MEQVKKSVLYDKHLQLTDASRLAEFAGYLMPLWYTSVSQEHQAVRQTAGLFDCTHMGVLEVAGTDAMRFLEMVTSNAVGKLQNGSAQYSYILDEAGNVLDDIIVYCRGENKYMLVVNAVNNDKIKAWFKDAPMRLRRYEFEVAPEIRDMRNLEEGDDCLVDIALQGPTSRNIILQMMGSGDEALKNRFGELKPFEFMQGAVGGVDVVIARTGYTGARVGFELLVHPEKAPQLWDMILDQGESFGVKPCGLGARDSLRIEAGLPLYGHELAGKHNISPFEAGYGWAVKLDKGFFFGCEAMRRGSVGYEMAVGRLEMSGAAGVRPVRSEDAVLNSEGRCVGWVLSCAKVGDKQLALIYLERAVKEGDTVGVYYAARNSRHIQQGRKEKIEKNEVLSSDIFGKIVEKTARF